MTRDEDVIAHAAQLGTPPPGGVSYEIARSIRFLAVATAVLISVLTAMVLGLFYLRSHDLHDQIKENQKSIQYLCQTTAIIDILVVQEKQAYNLELHNDRSLGPKQREWIRDRIATLEVAHVELSDQQPCQEVQ